MIGASALAAVTVAGASANAAQAEEPFYLELNQGELQLGSAELLVAGPTSPVILDGDIDPATGELTVPPEGVHMPYLYVEGAYASIDPQEPVTGTFDEASGELNVNMLVDILVQTWSDSCSFENFEWNL